jgi:hypothetical protein
MCWSKKRIFDISFYMSFHAPDAIIAWLKTLP